MFVVSSQAGRPKTLRSSSKQAAGRARPGRGPRVTRKPQAAQVEPGRRHRKSRASSLPFLRGDLVTGKREVPPTGGSQRTSGPGTRLLRPEAQRPARRCRRRRGLAASIAIPDGEGRRVGRERGGAGQLRRAAELGGGGANRLSRRRPQRPPRGALRRPGGRRRSRPNLGRRAAGRVAATPGTLWPCGPRTPLSAAAFRSHSRSQRPRTRVHARAACCAPRPHTSRAPAGRPHAPRPTPQPRPPCPGRASGRAAPLRPQLPPPRAAALLAALLAHVRRGRKSTSWGSREASRPLFTARKTFHHGLESQQSFRASSPLH